MHMIVPNMEEHTVLTGGFMGTKKTRRVVVLLEPELYETAMSIVDKNSVIQSMSHFVRMAIEELSRNLSSHSLVDRDGDR